jgi:hypothetical protein
MSSIKSFQGGKVIVITDDSANKPTPIFCRVCDFAMKNLSEDSESFQKHGICSRCDGRFTNYPGVDWSSEHTLPANIAKDMWDDYIKERLLLSTPIINFK